MGNSVVVVVHRGAAPAQNIQQNDRREHGKPIMASLSHMLVLLIGPLIGECVARREMLKLHCLVIVYIDVAHRTSLRRKGTHEIVNS